MAVALDLYSFSCFILSLPLHLTSLSLLVGTRRGKITGFLQYKKDFGCRGSLYLCLSWRNPFCFHISHGSCSLSMKTLFNVKFSLFSQKLKTPRLKNKHMLRILPYVWLQKYSLNMPIHMQQFKQTKINEIIMVLLASFLIKVFG